MMWIRKRLIFFSFLLLEGIVVCLSMRLVPLMDGRREPPFTDSYLSQVSRILALSRSSGAEIYRPGRVKSLESDLQSALAEVNRQSESAWYARDYTRATGLLENVRANASATLKEVRERGNEDRSRAEDTISEASAELARLEKDFSSLPKKKQTKYHVAEAQIKLGMADIYLERGRFQLAVGAARESLESLEEARREQEQALLRFSDPREVAYWRGLVAAAVDGSRGGRHVLLVVKAAHRLDVYRQGKVERSIPVDIGADVFNPKRVAGDRVTPEGAYSVIQKKGKGESKFGLALLLNYPNEEDKRRFALAKKRGEIPSRAHLGGLIEIHGQGGRGYDWTDGCIAPSDEDMLWLFREIGVGTQVFVVGTDRPRGLM
jgi:tetratricopeptide (TPR) repeat protein